MDVLLGLAAAVGAALGLLGAGAGAVHLLEAGVLGGGLLADGGELADDVVDAGDLDAVPHDLELRVDAVGEARVVGPDKLGVAVLPGPHREDPVLVLELLDRVVAVRPPVLQLLHRQRRRVRLGLQVRQQRRLRVDAGDLRPELVLALGPARQLLLPSVLAAILAILALGGGGSGGARRGRELDARVLAHEHGELLAVLRVVELEGQVVEDVAQGLGRALGLEEVDGVRQVRQHVVAVADVGGGHGGGRGRGRGSAALRGGCSGDPPFALLPLRGRAVRLGCVGRVRRRWRRRREPLVVVVVVAAAAGDGELRGCPEVRHDGWMDVWTD